MEEDEFVGEEKKDGAQSILEKTKGASPKQEELLKKQAEFELGERDREVKEIEGSKKRKLLFAIFRWGILVLFSVFLYFLAKWMLF